MERLAIKSRGPEQPVRDLSGGNQQKVALARVLHQQADVLLLDEPTRGIDVGTKAEIYRLIGMLAAEGKAIIFVSSYSAGTAGRLRSGGRDGSRTVARDSAGERVDGRDR